MNDRPHPDLLPQEKENRSPRFGDADALGFGAVSSPNDDKTVIAIVTHELRGRADAVPSPGGEGQDEGGRKTHSECTSHGESLINARPHPGPLPRRGRVGLLRKNGQRNRVIWLVVLEFEVNGRPKV